MFSHTTRPKIALVLFATLLVLLPAPVRVSCLVHPADSTPQPFAEPCDPVLISHDTVHINLVVFDIALAVWVLALPGLLWLIGQALPIHPALPFAFTPIPDSPPPRLPTRHAR